MPLYINNSAQGVGPTIDTNAEHDVPLFREEAFDIPILPSGVALKSSITRPMTHKVSHDLVGPNINTVLVRNSNINPENAGQGDTTSNWRVSRQMMPGMGMGEEIAAPRAITSMVLAVGLGLGFLLWQMRK